MDFSYNDMQRRLKQSIVEFVQAEINPQLPTVRDPADFDRALWRQCAAAGLLQLMVPAEWSHARVSADTNAISSLVGGSEPVGLLSQVMALESFGYACTDNSLPFALAAQACTVQGSLLSHGSDEQKNHYLPACTRGDAIGAHAMTEPAAGSDTGNIQMLAKRVEGGYTLSGRKIMISLAPLADFIIVFATLNPEAGRWGQTAFLVDNDSAGFEVSSPVTKVGLEGIPMGHIALEDCFVPDNRRLGPEGAGAAIAQHSLELERTCILASQVGRMQRQLEEANSHAKSRHQFGQPVAQFQSVSNRLADMRLRVENAQLLLYKTAWKYDQGEKILLESALLKLLLSEHFLASSMDSMRIHGGYSYTENHPAGRDTQDALGGILYAGTSDIQRNIIAGLLES